MMHHALFDENMNCWCVFEDIGGHQLRFVCRTESKIRADKYAKNLDRNKVNKIEWRG